VDSGDQRARDSDARGVLESELKRAEARRVELLAEYKDGQPDKQGIESRNYQRYLDRVEELKAAIARNESDIAGIRRELGRSAPATPGAPSGAK
jgi:predicted metal-dependent peptidase